MCKNIYKLGLAGIVGMSLELGAPINENLSKDSNVNVHC